MSWHYVQLRHARNETIDVYVRNHAKGVEILVGSARERACFSADRVIGEVKAIHLDQYGNPVSWKIVRLPDYYSAPEMDSRHNKVVPGYEPTLDDLRHSIANGMNRTLRDRGFSRFAKKHLVGEWRTRDSRLNFESNGTYSFSGSPDAFPFPPPEKGKWSIGSNMLHLMNERNDRGIRVAIVSIDESELRFHGRRGALFHLYEKRPNKAPL
jgi:hypothetical protein